MIVRQVADSDKSFFINFSLKLARYNRSNHQDECRYDDFELVLDAVKIKAENTFFNRNNKTLILIAELENKPAGYAVARIFTEDNVADNGTGAMGLFDELFVDKPARGRGVGQKLTGEVLNWFKMRRIKRVKLHAYSWNKSAIKFYEQHGFQEYTISMEKFI